VQARASRDALAGAKGGALVVRVTAPPVQGEANAAVARLVGRALGVPPSAVVLVRGAAGREKLLRIAGVTAEQARARLRGRS
jgi:uncharacterized protein